MWSTIKSPTNSTKKLIVVKQTPNIIEPQLITVNSSNSNSNSNHGGKTKGGIRARLYTCDESSVSNSKAASFTLSPLTTTVNSKARQGRKPLPDSKALHQLDNNNNNNNSNTKNKNNNSSGSSSSHNKKRLQISTHQNPQQTTATTKIAATPQLSVENPSLCTSASA